MARIALVRSAVLAAVVALLVAGCSEAPAPPAPTVVPTAWVDATTAAWPGTAGRRDGAVVLGAARQCALGGQRVRVLDTEFRTSRAGYGPLPGTADGFVHRCELTSSRNRTRGEPVRATGRLELTRYPDAAALQNGVARFRAQPDLPEQDNEVTRLTSGRYAVDALRRWYPTTLQGLYQAMVVDEQQRATLVLEVDSLAGLDFERGSTQQVADALADFLDRSQADPTVAPPPVPSWADSVWQDAGGTFRIAVARGWSQDPRFGAMDDPTATAHLVDAGRSASMVVTVVRPAGVQPLPGFVRDARALVGRQGYTVESDEPTTLDDGYPAHALVWTRSGKRVAVVLVATPDEAFVVEGTAPVDRWDATREDLSRMARSFAVVGG